MLNRLELEAVLIDLDGTLTDPAPGIIGCFRHALSAMGYEVPAERDLTWIIGPPLRQSFRKMLRSEDGPEDAVRLYRQRYATTGLFEAAVYDGIEEMLADLKDTGTRLVLCTSKPRIYAKAILDHFALSSYFDAIYGAELDGTRENKADLIEHILSTEALTSSKTAMVGDRRFDVEGAKSHGIPTVGVLWGYGGAEELEAAGAAVLCRAPRDTLALLSELTLGRAMTAAGSRNGF